MRGEGGSQGTREEAAAETQARDQSGEKGQDSRYLRKAEPVGFAVGAPSQAFPITALYLLQAEQPSRCYLGA